LSPVTQVEKNLALFDFSGFLRKSSLWPAASIALGIYNRIGRQNMKEPRKDEFKTWSNDPGLAVRYAPIHGMVTEVLARIDPDGYTNKLEGFRAHYKPERVGEAHVVALMADLSWRIRGCFYLENEILKRGMEACPQEAPDQAMLRVFLRETKGGGLLSKLSRYESRLSREFSRCLRILELSAKNRKYAEARIAAELARHKPCTSVIQ